MPGITLLVYGFFCTVSAARARQKTLRLRRQMSFLSCARSMATGKPPISAFLLVAVEAVVALVVVVVFVVVVVVVVAAGVFVVGVVVRSQSQQRQRSH